MLQASGKMKFNLIRLIAIEGMSCKTIDCIEGLVVSLLVDSIKGIGVLPAFVNTDGNPINSLAEL